MSILVLKAGDIELNSGPNKKSHSYFSCCHWNVNSSPTWNSYLIDIVKLQHGVIIKGYNLIRSDHPSNIKRGGVCINYKKSLAVRTINITSLTECLVCEVTIQNKKGYVAVVYRSPSQSTSEFESFLSGLEDLLSNALCSKSQFTVVLGDLNARSPAWWSEDITTLHGTQIDSLTTMHGFKQIISDPTHILPQSSSCI